MEWGTTEGNMALLSDAYKKISELYCQISYVSMDEIKRESPRYWEQYRSCEKELDDKCNDLSTEGYKILTDKMVSVWTKIVDKVENETNELVAAGMPPPQKKPVDYGISFCKEDSKAETISVGFITQDEIRLYFDNKISVKEIQERNVTEYNEACGHRTSSTLLVGPCGLSNDGTGNVKFNWREAPAKTSASPSLQGSVLLAPEPSLAKEFPATLEDLLDDPPEIVQPKSSVIKQGGVMLLDLD
jgi:hypothetical protein